MVVPDGAAVVRDDLELTDAALRRYGPKLYVLGDLTLTEASRAALGGLEYLHVAGDVTLPAALVENFTALDAAKKITSPAPRFVCVPRGRGRFLSICLRLLVCCPAIMFRFGFRQESGKLQKST